MKSSIKCIVLLWFMMLAVTDNCCSQNISCKDDIYTLSVGDMSFSVSSKTGGRIISFKKGGCELLTSDSIHPVYYGATLWLSPQSAFWPPYPTLDKLPYNISVADDKLCMVSRTDDGIRVTKEFSISKKDTAIYIRYKVENISGQILKLALWDVARVFGGLSFFPVGEDNDEINRSDIPDSYIENGVLWFPFTQKENEKGQKLFSTASEGWIAHYYNNLLFVKCFPDIRVSEIPPEQGEAEIYVAPEGKYLELENHGCYTSLAPNESVEYNQKWFLISLDQGKSKQKLLQIVRQLNKK